MTTVDTAAAVEQAESNRTKAHEDAEQATALVAELEQRLRNGDMSITPKQLTDAEQKARHADLFKESHDGVVRKAREVHDQAVLDATAAKVREAQAEMSAALDRTVGPIVAGFTELLVAVQRATAAKHETHGVITRIPIGHTTRPAGVVHQFSNVTAPYQPDLDVPAAHQLVGELLGAAIDNAFENSHDGLLLFQSHEYGQNWMGSIGKYVGGPRYGAHPPAYVTPERLDSAGQ